MEVQLDDKKLTPLLYLSKAGCVQQCPMRYYWQHHCHLTTKTRPEYFRFGSATHKAVEIGLNYGFPSAEAVLCDRLDLAEQLGAPVDRLHLNDIMESNEKDRNLMLQMVEAFENAWKANGIKTLLSTEYSVQMPLTELGITSKYFTHWVAKADFVFEDMEGVWVGDLKTTSGYGPATAKYYHSSPQTKSYFHILKKRMPKLRGTKIFVVTKQKVRCEVEPILMTDTDHFQAQLFIEESVRHIDQLEDDMAKGQFPSRFMTSCVNHFGSECPYIPLCINPMKDNEYAHDLINNWYGFESPDKHLELD